MQLLWQLITLQMQETFQLLTTHVQLFCLVLFQGTIPLKYLLKGLHLLAYRQLNSYNRYHNLTRFRQVEECCREGERE